jgi:hypothetical protein
MLLAEYPKAKRYSCSETETVPIGTGFSVSLQGPAAVSVSFSFHHGFATVSRGVRKRCPVAVFEAYNCLKASRPPFRWMGYGWQQFPLVLGEQRPGAIGLVGIDESVTDAFG